MLTLLFAITILLLANSNALLSIEFMLKFWQIGMIKIDRNRGRRSIDTHKFFSSVNFVIPTSWMARFSILSILQLITAKFSKTI